MATIIGEHSPEYFSGGGENPEALVREPLAERITETMLGHAVSEGATITYKVTTSEDTYTFDDKVIDHVEPDSESNLFKLVLKETIHGEHNSKIAKGVLIGSAAIFLTCASKPIIKKAAKRSSRQDP